jgi:hypothetical protein
LFSNYRVDFTQFAPGGGDEVDDAEYQFKSYRNFRGGFGLSVRL